MRFEDRTLECVECGEEFVFTAGEQEFFATKGFTNEPRRCPACRAARKSRNSANGGYRPRREMYPAVCARCGRETEVPFQPRDDRPVYCSECFSLVRAS